VIASALPKLIPDFTPSCIKSSSRPAILQPRRRERASRWRRDELLMNWIEAAAVVFGACSVALTIRQSLWCWPAGLVQVADGRVANYNPVCVDTDL